MLPSQGDLSVFQPWIFLVKPCQYNYPRLYRILFKDIYFHLELSDALIVFFLNVSFLLISCCFKLIFMNHLASVLIFPSSFISVFLSQGRAIVAIDCLLSQSTLSWAIRLYPQLGSQVQTFISPQYINWSERGLRMNLIPTISGVSVPLNIPAETSV